MESEFVTAHPGGFIEDDSTGIERTERIRLARELGRRILSEESEQVDLNGKDAILAAFVPSTRFSRIK